MTIVEVAAPRWNLNGVDYTPKIDTNAGGNNITTAAAGNTLYQQTVAPQSSQNTTVAYVTSSTTPEPWAPTRPWQYRSSWSAQESEVPEPNEMLLMGLGLVAVALVGRRRSKTPSANRTVN